MAHTAIPLTTPLSHSTVWRLSVLQGWLTPACCLAGAIIMYAKYFIALDGNSHLTGTRRASAQGLTAALNNTNRFYGHEMVNVSKELGIFVGFFKNFQCVQSRYSTTIFSTSNYLFWFFIAFSLILMMLMLLYGLFLGFFSNFGFF